MKCDEAKSISSGMKHGRYVESRPDVYNRWLLASFKKDSHFPNPRSRRSMAFYCRVSLAKAERMFVHLWIKVYGREPTERQL